MQSNKIPYFTNHLVKADTIRYWFFYTNFVYTNSYFFQFTDAYTYTNVDQVENDFWQFVDI